MVKVAKAPGTTLSVRYTIQLVELEGNIKILKSGSTTILSNATQSNVVYTYYSMELPYPTCEIGGISPISYGDYQFVW